MAEETTQVTAPEVETADNSSFSAPAVDSTTAEPEYKPHPAHEKLLSELPEAWHQKVIPHLQEQDKYYQQQMERFTPFKDLVEQDISADLIKGGLNLAKAIEVNPVEVYSSLQTYLKQNGLLAEDARQAAMDIMEDESGEDFDELFDEDDEIPSSLKREIQELKELQRQQSEYLNQQELERQTEIATVELEREMTSLKGKYQISEAHEVAIYDLMNAALSAGRDISIAEAAQQLQAMIGGFQPVGAVSANEPAPKIVGNAGGAGVAVQNLEVPKDSNGKKEMLSKLFEQYKQANR